MADWEGISGPQTAVTSGGMLAHIAATAPSLGRVSRRRVPQRARNNAATVRSRVTAQDVLAEVAVADRTAGVLDETLFRSALGRQRKRADRFDEVFALAAFETDPSLAGPVAESLAAATRDSDVIGWLEQGTVLGVILPEIPRADDRVALGVEERLRREFARRAGTQAGDSVTIRWYLHTGPAAKGNAASLSEADPLLDHIRHQQRRRTLLDGLKRALDIAGSLGLMLFLLPVFVIVAALVKLTSRGPVLFRQVRVGQLARPFTMLKFRTMHVNNDSALHQQFVTDFIKTSAAKKEQKESSDAAPFKIKNDPRVTPVGRMLRKTSLDELPQLWNVFRGDMSLVGPRPPLFYELEQYRSWHWRRVLEAKPGVTGLWQVTGRSRTTFDEMVRLDLRYVKTRNFWTDVRILLATPRAVVTGKGAC
jgi:lipopolysaccharide/colanic/teichoic acid biosynthesis glycosyltransferase